MSIIQGEGMQMEERPSYLSDQDRSSCSERGKQMPFSSGEDSLTTAGSAALTVPCSETKADTCHQTLSDRLTPSLISRGLVRGIIPTSMRRRSDQLTLGTAFFGLAGEDAGEQRED